MRTALVMALMLVASPAAAQVFLEPPLLVLSLDRGGNVTAQAVVSNPTDRSYFFQATATGDLRIQVQPDQADLPPRGNATVRILVSAPADAEPGPATSHVSFVVVDRLAGTTFERELRIDVEVSQPQLYLGLLRPVWGPPFSSGWGLFALEAATWLVVGVALAWLATPLVRRVAPKATDLTHGRIATSVRRPLAFLVIVLGTSYAWRLTPAYPALDVIGRGIQLVAIVAGGVFAYRTLRGIILYAAERSGHRRSPHIAIAPVLEKVIFVGVLVFVALYGLRIVGIDAGVLLAGGVVAGLVISFAAQDTLSNLFSGMFLLIDRPFQEGDEIRLSTGEVCRVDHIGLRSTRLFHFRHEQQIILPNNELATKRVTNLSYPDETHRLLINFDVAYRTDLRDAVETLIATAKGTQHVMSGPGRDPIVWVKAFAESGIHLELRVYIPSSRYRNPVRTALIMAIKKAFDEKGIEIPVPQRDIRVRGDLVTKSAE